MTKWLEKTQLCVVCGLILLVGGTANAQLPVTCNWVGQIYRDNLGSGQYTIAAPFWGSNTGWSQAGLDLAGSCLGGFPNNTNALNYSVVIQNASAPVVGANLGKLASVIAVNPAGTADINPTLTSLSITNSLLGLRGAAPGTLTTGRLTVDSSTLGGGTYTVQNSNPSAPINTFNNATIESSNLVFQGSGAAATFTGSLGLDQYSTHVGKLGTGTIVYGVLSNLTGSSTAPILFDGVTISAGTLSHPTATIVETGGGMLFFNTNTVNGGVLLGNFQIAPTSNTAFNGTQLEGWLSVGPYGIVNFNTGTIALGGIDNGPRGSLYTSGTVANNLGSTIANAGYFENDSTLKNDGAINNNPSGTLYSYSTLSNTLVGAITNAGYFLNDYKLNNSGRLDNDSGATLDNYSTLSNNPGGTLTNAGTLSNKSIGALDNYGTLNNLGALNNFGTLDIGSGGTLNNNGGTLTNSGTIKNHARLNNSGTLSNASGGHLENYGTLNNKSGGTLTNSGVFDNNSSGDLENSGTLNNSGTFYNNSGGKLTDFGTLNNQSGGTLANSGTLHISVGGNLTNAGTITNNSGATLTNFGTLYNFGTVTNTGHFSNDFTLNNYGSLSNNFNGTLYNSGTVNNNAGGTLTNTGSFENHGTLNNAGMLNNDSGGHLENGDTWSNSGTLNNNTGGTLTNARFFENDGTLNNAGILSNISSTLLYNHGTLSNTSGGAITNGGYWENDGTLTNDHGGTLTNTGYFKNNGALNNAGTMSNHGTVVIASGASLTNDTTFGAGTYTQSAGSTVVDGTFASPTTIQINGGTLKGSGVIEGNVAMGGTLSPGDSPGRLTITGNYTQSSGGTFLAELSGLAPGTQYDQLAVSGTAALDGTLDVVLLSGFKVKVGDSFELMMFASQTGQFSTYDLPKLPAGEKWQWTYDATDFTLSVDATGTPTPEPGSFLLLGSGLLGMAGKLRRKLAG